MMYIQSKLATLVVAEAADAQQLDPLSNKKLQTETTSCTQSKTSQLNSEKAASFFL